MRNDSIIYETAMFAGTLMLESGSEMFRVEDIIHRILSLAHMDNVEVFATTTGIISTAMNGEMPITKVVRITRRINNLKRIVEVNDVSRIYVMIN